MHNFLCISYIQLNLYITKIVQKTIKITLLKYYTYYTKAYSYATMWFCYVFALYYSILLFYYTFYSFFSPCCTGIVPSYTYNIDSYKKLKLNIQIFYIKFVQIIWLRRSVFYKDVDENSCGIANNNTVCSCTTDGVMCALTTFAHVSFCWARLCNELCNI